MAEPVSSALKPLLPVARKVLPWALRHPFVLRLNSWRFALLAWFALAVGLLAAGVAGPAVFLPLGLVLLVIVAGLFGWYRLTASSDRPVVLITEFAASTATGIEAAHHHRQAVLDRLQSGPLGGHVDVRGIPVPVTADQAKRLLDTVPAVAVVFGSVKAVAGHGTWEAELLARWPGDAGAPAHVYSADEDLVIEKFNRRVAVPDRHEVVLEPQMPLERLIAERFESDHADRVEGTLLALVASGQEADETAADLARAAERYRSQLSPRTCAALEVVRARTGDFPSGLAMLDAAEAAGLGDADHADLWSFLAALSFLGHLSGEVPIDRYVRFAERAVAADPSSPVAHYNLGEAYFAIGRPGDALVELTTAAKHPDYRDRYYVHLARGMAAYNSDRPEDARDAYALSVSLRASARGFLYLGDAHRRLGDETEARVNYARALRLQPTLVDAHRGYWYTEDPAIEPPKRLSWWFDPAYRVLSVVRPRRLGYRTLYWLVKLQYRLHPEDSRVHFMLGSHALLLEYFEEAEERLRFAYDLFEGADLEALARLIVLWGLEGRLDEVREGLATLREAPSLETGTAPAAEELLARARNLLLPFVDRPELTTRPYADDLLREFKNSFPEVLSGSTAQSSS